MAFLAAALCGGSVFADSSGSLSSAGGQASSASYTLEASLGDVAVGQSTGGLVTNTSGAGFAGVKSLALSAAPSTVNESSTSQLAGSAIMDDDSITELSGADISWSLVSGPVSSIGATGLATAAAVYASGTAVVRGSWTGVTNTTPLLVLNSNTDNYGTYAGDAMDDAWQVQYFGIDNPLAGPNADADGNGHTNLFKYVAGLNPTEPASRFVVNIQPVSGQPGQMQIVFSPVVSGRTYTVVTKSSLGDPSWAALSGSTQSDNGQQRTVTDLGFSGAKKFYRVSVSKP